jgi:hypothetical protein
MNTRRAKSIAVIIAWLLVMTYLAYYSGRVFGVLTYDETQLMPSNIEPIIVSNIVNRYIGSSNETTLIVVIKLNGSDSIWSRLGYVGNVVDSIDAPNISVVNLVTVYNDVYSRYNESINNATNEIMSNVTQSTWSLYWSLNNQCRAVISINREYYSMVSDISRKIENELNATLNYGQLLYQEIRSYYLRNYPNASLDMLFLLTTRDYINEYGYNPYVYELANKTLKQLKGLLGPSPTPYQLIRANVTGLLLNNYEEIIRQEYPGLYSISNVTGYVYQKLMEEGVNETTLKLAALIGPNATLTY